MKYTKTQIDEYFNDYIKENEQAIKSRLEFLLEYYTEQDQVISPDVWYCFEEARHTYMMGDFVACIIMCTVVIERHLVKLLEFPYYKATDKNSALSETGYKILKPAFENNIINQKLFEELEKLFELRNNYVHGVSKENPKDKKGTRPQMKDPIKHAFVWTDHDYGKELENDAQFAIKTLFRAWEELHYSKLNYYK
ncbi:MAG: hypothetical protein H8E98_07765 [Bacteroidetes bacterium]|nr:hypothetical protein [Bacteroidota bacterium]